MSSEQDLRLQPVNHVIDIALRLQVLVGNVSLNLQVVVVEVV
jgi:hypothetical protein